MVEESREAPVPARAAEDRIAETEDCVKTAEEWLAAARQLVPAAAREARAARGFPGRWRLIAGKLERLPQCLSDLSSHPFFSRNALCREQLQSVCRALEEAVDLAGRCDDRERQGGKLQMQSDLDALSGKLDLNIRDCRLLVKTGVLGEVTPPQAGPGVVGAGEVESGRCSSVRELLARLQIGHIEAKHKAVEGLLEAMKEDEKAVLPVLGRSNIAALIHLLTATSLKIREKTATVICLLAEAKSCEGLLVSEGALPPLIRLLDSGSLVGREKAVVSLQKLSASAETARAVVGHGGVQPLVEVCKTGGDSVSQSAAAGALKNLSAVPEVRQALAEEGVIRVMVDLLDCGIVLGSKEHAAEFLQNITSGNDSLRRAVAAEGGLRSLLSYIDGPLPQESAVSAVRNLVTSVSAETVITLGLLPRLVHVLKSGSSGAQQAAAAALCKVSSSAEVKRLAGEAGCLPPLVKLLEAKAGGAREAAAQAVAGLMGCQQNAREVKRDEKVVPNLVQLLDPSPQNTARKYAVSALLVLSPSKRCRRSMAAYGAIGYLKKLSEADVPGSRKLLERLERGRLRSLLFSRR